MSRALPISGSPATPPTADVADVEPGSAALSGTVAVYDPAMCCETGVCGPGVDPALLALARDLRWLAAKGATVQRFGLSQEPQAFVANPRVTGLMQAFGDAALPAILVNGEIRWHGRYPTRDELVAALAPTDADGGSCCTPGSGCC